MRRMYVAGNWKMNLNLAEAQKLIEGITSKLPTHLPVDLGVFPSFVLLHPLTKILEGTPIRIGAQNCYCEQSGAFTGEIAPAMIKDIGCDSVIIGHSERRHVIGETGELLKKKILAALEVGLEIIYCIGEKLEEREAGQTEAVLARQLQEGLGPDVDLNRVVVAYEPVWAMGTGKTATPEIAQSAHAFCRQEIGKLYNTEAAEKVCIQYGGSVKASNAQELMAQSDVDGALVGGASLKTDEFIGIIQGAIAAQS